MLRRSLGTSKGQIRIFKIKGRNLDVGSDELQKVVQQLLEKHGNAENNLWNLKQLKVHHQQLKC